MPHLKQESSRRASQASQRPTAQSSQRTQSTPRPSQSQRANTSQSQKSPEETQDIDRLVAEVIQYFLVMEQKRFPVKKVDITKLINGKCSPKTFKAIMAQAAKYLNDVFFIYIYFETGAKINIIFLGFWFLYSRV